MHLLDQPIVVRSTEIWCCAPLLDALRVSQVVWLQWFKLDWFQDAPRLHVHHPFKPDARSPSSLIGSPSDSLHED